MADHKIHCPVCGSVVGLSTTNKLKEHLNKSKTCYGSHMPILQHSQDEYRPQGTMEAGAVMYVFPRRPSKFD